MSNLYSLALQYQMNPEKQFFPVNSLRLFYFTMSDYYTQNNAAAREKITQLIPAVEAVFDARSSHRSATATATAQSDYEAVSKEIENVLTLMNSPAVRNAFTHLIAYIYPLQDTIFLNLYQDIMSDRPATPQHLFLLLNARAMDSIIFSTILAAIIEEVSPLSDPTAQQQFHLSLHHHVNMGYQINDLIDAVVFAKDDLDSGSFSPFKLIQKITTEPTAAKELITQVLATLNEKTTLFPFPTELQANTLLFYKELKSVIQPNEE